MGEYVKESTVQKQSLNRIHLILRWIDYRILEGVEKLVVSFGLIILSVIVFSVVLSRYFFGYSPDWSEELPRFIVIWITFFGMSYCVRKGEHVVIDVLLTRFKGNLKKYFYILILFICFGFFVYLTFISYELTVKIFNSQQKSVALGILMGYVYMALPIGCLLSAKNFLHIAIKNLSSKDFFTDLTERRN